jgi:UDP-4-amino-4,6-dideoxy-N-acetyl-beta-L-altrosamine transaminase
MIPYGVQNIDDSDINAVINVLKSPFLTQGPCVPTFESALCSITQSLYGVAVNSATSALHIACLALGLQKGDMVWTSPNSFVASANCALYCDADIDFVDIDSKTYNLCADKLEEKLKTTKKLPKIIIPVAFAGQSADMKKIKALSEQYGFKIIEDASHAIGALYNQKPVGCGDYADITIFSFHPVKIITTAEGGVAVTNSQDLAHKMNLLRSHGITRDIASLTKPHEGAWYYEQQTLGFNYRMTELQAALGLSQTQRLNEFVKKRHEKRDYYSKILADLPISLPHQDINGYSALHLYPICVDNAKIRKDVFNHLRESKIGVNVHYIPIHLQPHYTQMGFKVGDFPTAESYYSKAISLPMFPDLTTEQQDYIKESLVTALENVFA